MKFDKVTWYHFKNDTLPMITGFGMFILLGYLYTQGVKYYDSHHQPIPERNELELGVDSVYKDDSIFVTRKILDTVLVNTDSTSDNGDENGGWQ